MNQDKPRPSIDGFTLRRRTTNDEPSSRSNSPSTNGMKNLRSHAERGKTQHSAAPEILPRPEVTQSTGLLRSDIDASLKAVDEEPAKKAKKPKKWFLKRKAIISFAIILLIVGGGGFALNRLMAFTGRVFSGGNVFDLLGSGTKLKQDKNGWSHILVFGTSEDDPGHQGAELTDSILVVSVNQEQKKAAMVSMPRDMWVDYGAPCLSGYAGKINVVYSCYAGNGDVAAGAKGLQDSVGDVFGLDVQYYVKVNYAVVRDVTTALGGVTVSIEGAFGAPGIYDSNMGKLLKLPNGPATLQGEQALAFVRARGEGAGSYGLNGNFSREANQQKMIMAMRDKALSLGTLANPVAMNNLLESLGNNIRTNFAAGEIKTLANLAKDIGESKVTHITLNDEKHPVVTTGMYSGQSIVRPIAGLTDYSKIQAYIQGKLDGGSVESEDASVSILNGSDKAGVAAAKQTELTQVGLINTTIGDTSYTPTKSVVWYDLSGGQMPKTTAKLESLLGVKATGTTLPTGVQSTSDFVIILGN